MEFAKAPLPMLQLKKRRHRAGHGTLGSLGPTNVLARPFHITVLVSDVDRLSLPEFLWQQLAVGSTPFVNGFHCTVLHVFWFSQCMKVHDLYQAPRSSGSSGVKVISCEAFNAFKSNISSMPFVGSLSARSKHVCILMGCSKMHQRYKRESYNAYNMKPTGNSCWFLSLGGSGNTITLYVQVHHHGILQST